ncbi:hypothetical protein Slin15195_G106840 [Septoria linicola]|uniref:Uncharacterized protein n=1 Tax=Septoria linicola TaxID=215465 RepID=A0A9Q9AYB4_9PEZI|nr:hypothetical protein Slin14017_G069810 [Septoria linicola]USW57365.1 hypothetical protein Slin15195_G106840 [Septoria linicola]
MPVTIGTKTFNYSSSNGTKRGTHNKLKQKAAKNSAKSDVDPDRGAPTAATQERSDGSGSKAKGKKRAIERNDSFTAHPACLAWQAADVGSDQRGLSFDAERPASTWPIHTGSKRPRATDFDGSMPEPAIRMPKKARLSAVQGDSYPGIAPHPYSFGPQIVEQTYDYSQTSTGDQNFTSSQSFKGIPGTQPFQFMENDPDLLVATPASQTFQPPNSVSSQYSNGMSGAAESRPTGKLATQSSNAIPGEQTSKQPATFGAFAPETTLTDHDGLDSGFDLDSLFPLPDLDISDEQGTWNAQPGQSMPFWDELMSGEQGNSDYNGESQALEKPWEEYSGHGAE